jgi:hypothetical protein
MFHSLLDVFGEGSAHKTDTLIAEKCLVGSTAIVGGPIASLHARFLLGVGDVSPLLGVHLPVSFEIRNYQKAAYENPKRSSLIVEGRSSEANHLLITSIPLSPQERAFNIAGLRAFDGTAIKFLFQQNGEGLLYKLYQQTRRLTAWQALFPVVVDRNGNPIDLARDFSVFEIKADFDKLINDKIDILFFDKQKERELNSLRPVKNLDQSLDYIDRPLGWSLREKKRRVDALNQNLDRLQEEFKDVFDEVLARRASVSGGALKSGMGTRKVSKPTRLTPKRLSEADLAAFKAHVAANPWDKKQHTPSAYIGTICKAWLGRGLRRADINALPGTLGHAYAAEISRNPARRVEGLIERPHKLPAGTPRPQRSVSISPSRPPSARLVSELSEEEKIEMRRQNREKQRRYRQRHGSSHP